MCLIIFILFRMCACDDDLQISRNFSLPEDLCFKCENGLPLIRSIKRPCFYDFSGL